jgi:Flp pilus assembly protein CpaB
VTKKFADVTIEEFRTRKTPIRPMSTLPIAVNRDRAEKGVIIAQPGSTSLALRSTAHTTESSFK